MIDCTKTVDFLREWKRLCEAYEECEFCPLNDVTDSGQCDVENIPDEAIAIVQKWSDEHPALTWYGKMQQLLPKANLVALTSGIQVCPSDVFGESAPNWRNGCSRNCAECWHSEYKEEDNG